MPKIQEKINGLSGDAKAKVQTQYDELEDLRGSQGVGPGQVGSVEVQGDGAIRRAEKDGRIGQVNPRP